MTLTNRGWNRLSVRATAVTVAVVLLTQFRTSLMATPAGVGEQLFKLTASDTRASDNFGESVAINGDIALVGARHDDSDLGSAFVFDVSTGEQLVKLSPTDYAPQKQFGNSVAFSGNTALIGAFGDGFPGDFVGSAYLFDISSGQQIRKLTASDGGVGDRFGTSVAIGGNVAVIGAFGDNNFAGSVYVFDVTTGIETAKLVPSDANAGDRFGWSVAISGNLAVIGAYLNDDASGAAYLFDLTTGQELRKLVPSDALADSHFGRSVAMSGNVAMVGAWMDDDVASDAGAAYLFDVTTGAEIGKLTAPDAALSDRFGSSVAVNGEVAVVGSPLDDDAGDFSGSAYVFDTNSGSLLAKLVASDATAGVEFGNSVAITPNEIIVGAHWDSELGNRAGAAYLFSIVPEPGSATLVTMTGLLIIISSRRGLCTPRPGG